MQQQQQQQSQFQRKRSFLNGLANVMMQRNVPLPPRLTGVPYPPGYDPNTSPWRTLEVSNSELGIIRLAGKDVDLFKLWAVVLQSGGGAKVRRSVMPFSVPALNVISQGVPSEPLGQPCTSPRPPRPNPTKHGSNTINSACSTKPLYTSHRTIRRSIP